MVPSEYIEKHGGIALIVTATALGGAWLLGYWHDWQELNIRYIFFFFSVMVATSAFLQWAFRKAIIFLTSDRE